jgi:hypothetical protein
MVSWSREIFGSRIVLLVDYFFDHVAGGEITVKPASSLLALAIQSSRKAVTPGVCKLMFLVSVCRGFGQWEVRMPDFFARAKNNRL